jgi:hypothetical protein
MDPVITPDELTVSVGEVRLLAAEEVLPGVDHAPPPGDGYPPQTHVGLDADVKPCPDTEKS